MRFADRVAASLPSLFTLPPRLREFIDFLDDNGDVDVDNAGAAFATVGGSQVTIGTDNRKMVRGHARSDDPAVLARLSLFVRAGGDGTYAGMWRDDDGSDAFVIVGSGSGSTALGILTRDPVAFVAWLALGYEELCWPEQWTQTPADVADDDGFAIDAGVSAFANGAARASDVVNAGIADMDDDDAADAFWRWMMSR